MNLLFISFLPPVICGVNNSVTSIINALSLYDHCYLLNLYSSLNEPLSVGNNENIVPDVVLVKSISDVSDSIDIVVFEEFYEFSFFKIAQRLRDQKIPYIITPHSSLTFSAQHNHAWLKKIIANILVFNKFAKNAAAIQFLTEGEKILSGKKWNKNSFVIPNGVYMPKLFKSSFNNNKLIAIFVGRLDSYQKGLDNLFSSFSTLQNELRRNNFSLKLFGVMKDDYKSLVKRVNEYGISDFVDFCGELTSEAKDRTFLESDLFIMTSRFEGHSIALLEALSYGLPVAITPGTNMTKEIVDFNAGWASDGNDSDSIAQMLLNVLSERDSIQVKSHNARKLAMQYNWGEIAERFHNELVKIVNGEEPFDK